ASHPGPTPRSGDDERAYLGHGVAERRQLAATDDSPAPIHRHDEPIDVHVELAQVAGQKTPFGPVLLDEIVNPFGVRPDSRPDLRRLSAALFHGHLVAPANTSLNAASSSISARSSSASVIVSGGSSRMTFPAVR